MNVKRYLALLQKTAVLAASIGISTGAISPVFAQPAPVETSQLNPRPSIFNEPPYNRALAPRSEARQGRRLNQRRNPRDARPTRADDPRVRTRPGEPNHGLRPDDRLRPDPRNGQPLAPRPNDRDRLQPQPPNGAHRPDDRDRLQPQPPNGAPPTPRGNRVPPVPPQPINNGAPPPNSAPSVPDPPPEQR